MACMNCRSAWVTRKGKDMASCPECCTMQRVKARKQGRLPASEQRNCQRCGGVFEAVGGNALRHARFCGTCLPIAQKERRAKWKADVAAGRRIVTRAKTKRPPRKCPVCDVALGPNQRAYCSRRCFGIARKNGTHAWDRTNQLESVWHRGGRWVCAPSRKPVKEITTSFQSFLSKVRTLMVRVTRQAKLCKVCGARVGESSRAYCSVACMKSDRLNANCFKCGEPTQVGPTNKRSLCHGCRRKAIRLERKLRKRDRGTYRKRCRKYGGYYNPDVTRVKVFERDGWVCHVCHRKTLRFWAHNDPREATVDHHPIPLSCGGDHDWHNVRCACRECNSEKSDSWDGQRRLALRE